MEYLQKTFKVIASTDAAYCTENTCCLGRVSSVYPATQMTEGIPVDVLKKHRAKDARTVVNRLPHPDSILQVRTALEPSQQTSESVSVYHHYNFSSSDKNLACQGYGQGERHWQK